MAQNDRAQAKAKFLELTKKLSSAQTEQEYNAIAKQLTSMGKKWGWDAGKYTSGGFTPKPEAPAEPVTSSIQQAGKDVNEAIDIARGTTDSLIPAGSFSRLTVETDPRVQEVIDFAENLARTGNQYTGLEEEALANLRSGLAGYDAPEVQAMREAANQEVNRNLATSLAQLQRVNARGGVRGAAAAGGAQDLQIAGNQTKGNIERDLIIKNADTIQQRRLDFGNLVNATENARAGRTATYTGLWSGASTAEEGARRGREAYNAAASDSELLTRAGTTTGLAGTIIGKEGSDAQSDVLKAWNDYMKTYMDSQLQLQKDNQAALRASLNA